VNGQRALIEAGSESNPPVVSGVVIDGDDSRNSFVRDTQLCFDELNRINEAPRIEVLTRRNKDILAPKLAMPWPRQVHSLSGIIAHG
jgi:hypothetical protein